MAETEYSLANPGPFEPIYLERGLLEDPRTKPGHIAAALAVAARACESLWVDAHWLRDGRVAAPISTAAMLRLSGFKGPDAAGKYLKDLQRWGYLGIERRPGQNSLYLAIDPTGSFDPIDYVSVPLGFVRDDRLGLQAKALYVALTLRALAEHRTFHSPLPADHETVIWEPQFPPWCSADPSAVRKLAGMGRKDQYTRYLDELAATSHVRVVRERVELLTNQVAETSLRRAYFEDCGIEDVHPPGLVLVGT